MLDYHKKSVGRANYSKICQIFRFPNFLEISRIFISKIFYFFRIFLGIFEYFINFGCYLEILEIFRHFFENLKKF